MLGGGDMARELDRGFRRRIGPVVSLIERNGFDHSLGDRLFGAKGANRVVPEKERLFRLERHPGIVHVSCGVPEWTVAPADAGVRLDKYLAAPERAGSRPKAALALERGKIFVNDREMTLADAAARVAVGDIVRLWI